MDISMKGLLSSAAAGRGVRLMASALMLATVAAPLPATVSPAQAKDLQWSNMRPPMTSEADTNDADGFAHLPDFAGVTHPMVVAPNGDLFVAGGGADVNASLAGTCDKATDANEAGATCSLVTETRPVLYRSTDGGQKFRPVYLNSTAVLAGGTAATSARIQKVVVSPKYPTDGFVGVVFAPQNFAVGTANASVNTKANGFAWSTDGGLTFPAGQTVTGNDGAPVNYIDWITMALSSDFSWTDSTGEIALGGQWENTATTSVYKAGVAALKGAANAAAQAATMTAVAEGTNSAAATDVTLDLSYSYSQDPVVLGRVFRSATTTYGQIRGAAGFAALGAGDSISAAEGGVALAGAAFGKVAFKDTYSSGGSYLASASNAAGTTGGVYRFNGTTWEEKTPNAGNCGTAGVVDMAVSGTASSTKIVATLYGTNQVCRSSNEGATFSKAEADGGDSFCDQCRVNTTAAVPTIGMSRIDPTTVYWANNTTSSATLAGGGLAKSTDMGSSWADTGLTNEPFIVSSVRTIDASKAFANATSAAGRAVFYTDNYGTGAAWRRSLRYAGTDLSLSPVPGSFTTDNILFVRRSAATTDNLLKTSDGGRTWKKTASDPFGGSNNTNELLATDSGGYISGSVAYIGGNSGHVSFTTDGGATWTLLSKSFGQGVDEFDFIDTARTMYIVTAQDNDNIRKLWWTSDSGATFTQIGDASTAWGSGNPATTAFNTTTRLVDKTTGKGTVIVVAGGAAGGGATSVTDIFTYDLGATSASWVKNETGQNWSSAVDSYGAGTAANGPLFLYNPTLAGTDAAPALVQTVDIPNITSSDWATRQRMNIEPPNAFAAGVTVATTALLSTCKDTAGVPCLNVTSKGQIQNYTVTQEFNGGLTVTSPANNSTTPTNVGNDGIPSVFRWNSVGKAACYEIQISLDNNFRSPTLDPTAVAASCPVTNGVSTGASYQVTSGIFALVTGQQYWWRVRVRATDSSNNNGLKTFGQWSAVNSFTVSTTSPTVNVPQPSLPLDNSNLPNLGTQLSWNNPPGVTQIQVQVTPLNGDGPAINLILGSAATSYDVPAPVFGTGPYVMLPGATYTWRIRTTSAVTSVSENDPSWGPWSAPRAFTTAKANAGTIQLVDPINGKAAGKATPTLTWKDANPAMFYYEVQLSSDQNFGEQGAKAPVFSNLIHGGQATPPNSWTVPDANALAKGTYFWRIRQRTQATQAGQSETGIAWTPAQSFVVQ